MTRVTYSKTPKKIKRPNVLYDFDRLAAVGHNFTVFSTPTSKVNYASLRAQAAKQGKRRGVRYSVRRIAREQKNGKPKQGFVVQLEEYLPT